MNRSTEIHSRAPTRIDLAGGTVDIWPIYLFLDNPVTLNLAIDLFAETELQIGGDPTHHKGEIFLRAEDQNVEAALSWEKLHSHQPHPALELHVRLLRYFAAKKPDFTGSLSLKTRARSPAGAGLGGSSALSVSIIGALASWLHGGPVDPLNMGEKLIDIVRDVETTVIRVPAGLQDYYGAMFGGLQSLRWRPAVHERAWLAEDILRETRERILLFYSGQSRNSGINNWALFKGFIDGDAAVREKFAVIAAETRNLEQALVKRDWAAAALAIAREWRTRRTLAPGISTAEMDEAFVIAARRGGARGKVCGAGGGGCFFLFFEDLAELRKNRDGLIAELEKLGVKNLPFEAVPHGLEVRVSRT